MVNLSRCILAVGTAVAVPLVAIAPPSAAAVTDCEGLSQLAIIAANDDGSYDEDYGPSRAIDGQFDPESRWSSENVKQLVLDLGSVHMLKEAGLAWHKGNERRSTYSLHASEDGKTYIPLVEDALSAGKSTAIERVDFDDVPARYLRVTGKGNEKSAWNSLLEAQAFGCGDGEIAATGDGSREARVDGVSVYGLRTDAPPSENFNLTHWKLTLPVDLDGDGRADEIEEKEIQGWSDKAYFYTDPATGGMVFRAVSGGATTPGSKYVRAELREMLRGGDESIATRTEDGTPNRNNWVFSSAPAEAQSQAGAIDGTMRARLAVNRVTRIGDAGKVGRVIIGQIHAKDAEPIRLYYRKLPTNKFGSIYFAHEPVGKDEVYVEMIGSRGDFAENPQDGIALDEMFEYEISVTSREVDGERHPILNVSIICDDGEVVRSTLDMSDGGYSNGKDFMYFKAGAYSQNNTTTWPERDFDQVMFYSLEVTHRD